MNCIETTALVLFLLDVKCVARTDIFVIAGLVIVGRLLRKHETRAKLKASAKLALDRM